jgi:phosphate transport system substrate-binding protein
MKRNSILTLAAVALLAVACGKSETAVPGSSTTSGSAQTLTINGAGATFPYPIYSKWFAEYGKTRPNVQINYQSIGSGGGIKQLSSKTVFFGATDGPMNEEQIKNAPGPILHLPTVAGGVVPIYNVPGVTTPLHFTGAALAGIYLGTIKKWNDPAIRSSNPGVTLPDTEIAVVHRSDGSGTTYIFVDYLSKVSPEFKTKVGVATSVSWPVGVGAKGNEGVSGLVKQTPGAVGYVELIYATQNNIAYGAVQNKAGKFVTASLDSITAAAAGMTMPDDFRVSITNADGDTAYPISSFTWVLLYEKPEDKERSKVMVEFMKWALTDGQQFAGPLGYAPLPKAVVDKEMQALGRIQ